MAWTYDAAQLSASKKDQVRLLAQDVDEGDQLLQDEEIIFVLAEEQDNVYLAAARCCELIAGQLAKQETLDSDVKQTPDRTAAKYFELADRYRQRARTRGAGAPRPFAGGVSSGDKAARSADGDRVAPSFTVGLHATGE